MSNDRRRLIVLEQQHDPLAVLSRLRPRDADFVRFESADLPAARQIVGGLPPEQCLVVSAAAGPLLWQAVVQQLGGDDGAAAVCELLCGPFLPTVSLPTMRDLWIERLQALAQGQPG